MTELRACWYCGRDLPLNQFRRDGHNGRSRRCRACTHRPDRTPGAKPWSSPKHSVERRLWDRLVPDENGCRVWPGGRNKRGYGAIQWHGEQWMTHRLAWVLAKGPVSDGLFVLHRCDNPPCCNPDHLWLGTNADNMADMVAKGRAGWQRPAPAARLRGLDTEAGEQR